MGRVELDRETPSEQIFPETGECLTFVTDKFIIQLRKPTNDRLEFETFGDEENGLSQS